MHPRPVLFALLAVLVLLTLFSLAVAVGGCNVCTKPWTHPDRGVLKCGQCIECRLAYSREWAIRITHEMRMHERSCMLTLTYNDEHLPKHGQLHKEHLQKFFKRLRFNLQLQNIKYVAVGEYGDISRRPHFHVCLFGIDFSHDRVVFGESINGDPNYISASLGRSWRFGNHSIGVLNFESAAYCARYILKKVKGVGASPLPLYSDPDTGEIVLPNPEFMICSKGISSGWFDKYFMSDVFHRGSVLTDQRTHAPIPRYYKDKLKAMNNMAARDLELRILSRINKADMVLRNGKERFRKNARDTYAQSKAFYFQREQKE